MTKRNVGHIFMTFVHMYDRENVRDVAAFGMFVCSYLFLAMPYDLAWLPASHIGLAPLYQHPDPSCLPLIVCVRRLHARLIGSQFCTIL